MLLNLTRKDVRRISLYENREMSQMNQDISTEQQESDAQGSIHSTLSSDPDLATLVQQLVQAMPVRLESLKNAFESGDMESLETISHQLKGTLGSYGFDPLTPYATRLELQVRARSPENEILESLNELVEKCELMTADPIVG